MLNNVVLMGRLTSDPELKHTPENIPVTNFTLAVDRNYVKSGTQRQADFINIVAWRNTAEFTCRYFQKGQLVAVQGSIQTRNYTDKEGNNRKSVEVVAENVFFAEAKKGNQINNETPSVSTENNHFEEFISEEDLPFDNIDHQTKFSYPNTERLW